MRRSIIHCIQEQITQHPEAIAVVHEHRVFTYRELDAHANRLSHYMTQYHVQSGDRVVFLMRRSFDLLATVLAIWKLGAVYVPLDPSTPSARLQHILNEVAPRCVISEPALLSKIPCQKMPVLTVKDLAYQDCNPDFNTLHDGNIDDQLAYLIYTSGSTGVPKGVMITHANLANHVTWLTQKFQFSSKDCFSFNSSMAFDFSVASTLIPLSVGAKIVMTSEATTLDLKHYFKQLTEHQVTFAKWTPSYFKLLVEYVEHYQPDLSAFRYIMLAGEELLTVYVKRWLDIYPHHSLINEYGPTEATVGITTHVVTRTNLNTALRTVPIGSAAKNTTLYVVGRQNNLCKPGEIGELLIGGASVARGYYKQPKLTADRFIDHPFSSDKQTFYKTGDLVKQLSDGSYLYVGRIDQQIKIDGYRVELSEIEYRMMHYPGIQQAAVTVEKNELNNATLMAYIVLDHNSSIDFKKLRQHLSQYLPQFMMPKHYYRISQIPLNQNRKVDYAALKKHMIKPKVTEDKQPLALNATLSLILQILKKYLNVDEIDVNASFFSLGVTSLLVVRIVDDINQQCDDVLNIQDLFFYSTATSLSDFLSKQKRNTINTAASESNRQNQKKSCHHEPIAIIGMDGRFPGANTCEALWALCREGEEAITLFDSKKATRSHLALDAHPVYARGILEDIDFFDAAFFNVSPKEAHLTDPQHRLLIESSWTALEKAGYAPGSNHLDRIGVFVSMNDSTYLVDHDLGRLGKEDVPDRFALQRLMSSQFLATKIAYHLNCTGPSFTVQTACSSSLAAIVLACQQLSSYHCEMALAGGVSIITPQDRPYTYQRDNIYSPDGHCRPFDASASGTVFSNGLGVVVLKRLSDAIRDRDSIISVIKGASMNNDGHQKMSYTAPSIQGQLDCIRSAQTMAEVDANSIQYIEAHGTGTLMGDPIEIEALTQAFGTHSYRQQYCALGSLKANIGHTHVAAGVAGLIKTALALQHQQIPPTLHYKQPNPNIDFDHSPFYVNSRLQYWSRDRTPRRAAVSAFGVGGTNAHVILEEAPESVNYPVHHKYHTLLLSAKTPAALQEYHDKLIHFLEQVDPDQDQHTLLADTAYTLQGGRTSFRYRSGVVCNDIADAMVQLKASRDKPTAPISDVSLNRPRVVFLFPGQGSQYINLSLTLYQEEPIYKKHLDECFNIASSYLGFDLKTILFPQQRDKKTAELKLYQTEYTHPLLFSIEYALAQLLMHWGIEPDAMLGHSLGEYVAACLSGVFSLEDAIGLVCVRGSAIASCRSGNMLVAPLSKAAALSFCHDEVHLAAVNADDLCVLSGAEEPIQTLQRQLETGHLRETSLVRQLKCSHPFHSNLLSDAVLPFQAALKTIVRNAPKIPYLSNLTGDWITESEVKSDDYWVNHLLKTVQFSRCAKQLIQYPDALFLEVGPGQTLLSLLQRNSKSSLKTVPLLPSAKSQFDENENRFIAKALKAMWCYGYPIHWEHYGHREKRRRIPLPTYPFQKQRYWFDRIISNPRRDLMPSQQTSALLYTPTWVRDPEPMSVQIPLPLKDKKHQWIIFDDHSALSQQTIRDLESMDQSVAVIRMGDGFKHEAPNFFTINPKEKAHYVQAIETIINGDIKHYAIIHFWSAPPDAFHIRRQLLDSPLFYRGLLSGLFIAQAFYDKKPQAVISCAMITTQLHAVIGNETVDPLKSGVLSLCRVLPLENKNIRISSVDIERSIHPNDMVLYSNNLISKVFTQLYTDSPEISDIVAVRHHYRWTLTYQNIDPLEKNAASKLNIIQHQVYLITGGLGGMGLTIADWLSTQAPITLLLLSRTPFPAQEDWEGWLETHRSDDRVSDKIKQLKQMINRGSRVVIQSGDVADYHRMQKIVKNAQERYGLIRGIFHLAGVPGEGLAVLKDVNNIRAVLSPKIQGIWVLARLFQRTELDFVVCASSLTAVVGGIGQLDYCAANLFLDRFMAQRPFKRCQRLLTVNWNAWSSVGMAVNVKDSKTHKTLYEGNCLSPEQAVKVLETALNAGPSQIIVSRFSPKDEIQRIIETFDSTLKRKENKLGDHTRNHRPNQNTYDRVAQIWKDVLGVKTIHEQDTFYSLGGDSLLAIQLLSTLGRYFDVELTLQDLAHAQTLRSMTQLIECQPIRSERAIIPLSKRHAVSSKQHKKSVYFIHPLGGTVLCYFPLMAYLKNDLRYYAIQDPELAKGTTLFYSIKDMAADYANEIYQYQKTGKIILVGYSFGGNVAIEMVSYLRKKGISVEKVILMDSWANLSRAVNPTDVPSQSTEYPESLNMIREHYGVGSHQYRSIQKRLSWLRAYTPTQVDVPVVLLKSQELLPLYQCIANEENAWAPYCSQTLVKYSIAGNHDTMLISDHLPNLGEVLNRLV